MIKEEGTDKTTHYTSCIDRLTLSSR